MPSNKSASHIIKLHWLRFCTKEMMFSKVDVFFQDNVQGKALGIDKTREKKD